MSEYYVVCSLSDSDDDNMTLLISQRRGVGVLHVPVHESLESDKEAERVHAMAEYRLGEECAVVAEGRQWDMKRLAMVTNASEMCASFVLGIDIRSLWKEEDLKDHL
jgi:hypothetical protein